MLADGITAPVPLAELENHLRDEITEQTKSGMDELNAFQSAVQKIGPPGPLRTEFRKTAGLYGFLSQRRTLKVPLSVNGILGLVWLSWTSYLFVKILSEMLTGHQFNGKFFIIVSILLSILIGSVLLIFGSRWGRCIVRINALALLAFWLVQDCLVVILGLDTLSHVSLRSLMAEQGTTFGFLLVSILILHLPEKANLKATVTL